MSGGIVYVDSSVALRTILNVPERARLRDWLQQPNTTFVSSRLMRTEIVRVLRRESRPVADAAPVLSRIGLLELTAEIHAVAESIERHVKTLDALHLATALLIGLPVTVATHDAAMKSVATSLGLAVSDPVEDAQ